jgi:hypothetical protein
MKDDTFLILKKKTTIKTRFFRKIEKQKYNKDYWNFCGDL